MPGDEFTLDGLLKLPGGGRWLVGLNHQASVAKAAVNRPNTMDARLLMDFVLAGVINRRRRARHANTYADVRW